MEVCGRSSLGEGALQFAVGQAAGIPVPDLRRVGPVDRAALIGAHAALAADADWGPLAGAARSPARLALDELALRALGVADDGERRATAEEIRVELARLVAERRQRGSGRRSIG
jgi:hypothetical protein